MRSVQILLTGWLLLTASHAMAQFGFGSLSSVEAIREEQAAQALESLRPSEPELIPWLRRMPKGADLHSHLSGATYAERYLKWAAEDGMCVDLTKGAIVPGPECVPPQLPARQLLERDDLYDLMLRRMSMRDFRAHDPLGEPSGHRQFFSAFERFSAAARDRTGDMLAEVLERAAYNGVQYLELMLSLGMTEAAQGAPSTSTDTPRFFATADAWQQRFDSDRDRLQGIAARVSQTMDRIIARQRQLLNCDDAIRAQPGCRVEVRFLAPVRRALSIDQVFAQAALGFELARLDSRFVGINLVAPEHHHLALADYGVQMRAIGWLGARWPQVPISLHAGEMTWGLVPPEYLRSHIRLAVEVAGARRIGHGVSIAHENDVFDLLRLMAGRQVTVEINLTSNDLVLGVKGSRHPLNFYIRHGVPVVLATDDEGILRIDITHEFLRAMTEQGLGYRQLKRMSRQSLISAFVAGESLWLADTDAPGRLRKHQACERWDSPSCEALREQSLRARLQYAQELAFERFEDELIRRVK